MKNLKKLGRLVLIILKTIPTIINYYKIVYKNIILNEEKITNKVKQMTKADLHINTKYVTGNTKPYTEEVEKFFRKHRTGKNKWQT